MIFTNSQIDRLSTMIAVEMSGQGYEDIDNSTDEKKEELQCRICLEIDTEENMICPCNCDSSVKWVHPSCINHWRAVRSGSLSIDICEICHGNYSKKEFVVNEEMRIQLYRCFVFSLVRDYVLFFLAIEMTISFLSFLIYLCDTDMSLVTSFGYDWNALVIYYIYGYLLLFFILGIIGIIILLALGSSSNTGNTYYSSRRSSSSSSSRSGSNSGGLGCIVICVIIFGIFIGLGCTIYFIVEREKRHRQILWNFQEVKTSILTNRPARPQDISLQT